MKPEKEKERKSTKGRAIQFLNGELDGLFGKLGIRETFTREIIDIQQGRR